MMQENGESRKHYLCSLFCSKRFSRAQLDEMEVDEKVFTWFSAHDWDEDSHLDGLELIKALRCDLG